MGAGQRDNEKKHVQIAYNRYCDAIFDATSDVEPRILSAVMGLEALLLKEQDALGYRLRMRGARLLGLLGLNRDKVLRVRKDLQHAYDCRSKFVHGEAAKGSDLRRIESQYGSNWRDDYVRTVLNYLRLVILAAICVPASKEELISIIDDSMISETALKELRNKTRDWKKLVGSLYVPRTSL